MKLSVWAAGLAVLGVIAASTAVFTLAPGGRREFALAGIYMVPCLFTGGLLCGMAFRRGITAVVIGLVLSLALCVPLFIMHTMRLLPHWAQLFVPIALLVVSWAWSGDWMLERPAPGRWVRLGLLLCAAFGTLFAGFVGFRVWSIPDAGSIAPPAAWTASAPLAPERNAAGLYREAARGLREPQDSPRFLYRSVDVLEQIRLATARPECQFEPPAQQNLVHHADRPPEQAFARLLSLSAQNRMGQGNLTESWNDIVALLRMARHFGEGAGCYGALQALVRAESPALHLAMDWARTRVNHPSGCARHSRRIVACPSSPPPPTSCASRRISSRTP